MTYRHIKVWSVGFKPKVTDLTAMKTISTRIRGMNEETEQLDEELVNIIGDVNDLTNGKVSIMKDNNTYKDIYTILGEISNVWSELTDKQHADLLSKLFGTRQTNVGAAIISNFSQAEEAINKMTNSAGNAMEEMSIITESLDYKINRFKETIVGIAQNSMSQSFLGGIVDTLTSIVEIVDKLTTNIGAIPTLMGTVTAALSVFKNVGKQSQICHLMYR